MKLYSRNENYKLYQGNMLDMLEVIESNSIDSIVTDPPYELNFMNKGWDNSGIAFQSDTWEKCYEVLKPGGYLLAFGGSRTFHRIACAIEEAGFEIRDTIMWLYGSGFPKSLNIGLALDKKNGIESIDTGVISPNARPNCDKSNTLYESGTVGKRFTIKKANNEFDGWGTALKPSFEPIIVARKPFKGSLVDNIIKNGVGGINIDECRVAHNEECKIMKKQDNINSMIQQSGRYKDTLELKPTSRFPANTILTYDETDFDEVCGGFPNTKDYGGETKTTPNNSIRFNASKEVRITRYKESGSASRYFYCAKASKKDRDEGLEGFEEKKTGELQGGRKEGSAGSLMLNKDGTTRVKPYAGAGIPKKNVHPTVKPTSLMQYLVRLVTPNNGIILDPFNGSGSTGKAVMYENRERNKNYKYIGIELTEEYLPISKARIEYVCDLEEEKIKDMQINIFDILESGVN